VGRGFRPADPRSTPAQRPPAHTPRPSRLLRKREGAGEGRWIPQSPLSVRSFDCRAATAAAFVATLFCERISAVWATRLRPTCLLELLNNPSRVGLQQNERKQQHRKHGAYQQSKFPGSDSVSGKQGSCHEHQGPQAQDGNHYPKKYHLQVLSAGRSQRCAVDAIEIGRSA
jgi:hypothetical protein